MNKYYYKKEERKDFRPFVRIFGIGLSILGIGIVLYVFLPLIIWQLVIAPVYANANITAPIPKYVLVSPSTIGSYLASQINNASVDYTNAENWYPGFSAGNSKARVDNYFLSIPKLNIVNAGVSTVDNDLTKHLVQLTGTPVAPDKGNAIIFGHSTLPQLFDPTNYKTILADAYKLQPGDYINVTVEGVTYSYKIFSILIVAPDDTSVLTQTYNDSYLTLITCTPPGTVWERQVIQARLVKI